MNLSYHIRNYLNGRSYIREYVPNRIEIPKKMIDVPSAWKGLESIIDDILIRFDISRNSCIEFGVEFGYSTVAFSNYFNNVVGVDTFEGDIHTRHKGNHFEQTIKALSKFENIKLYKSDYKDWIAKDTSYYDFAHVDIVHNYKETYECGHWCALRSKCVVFHDTESFPDVRKALVDIANATQKKVFNYPYCNGLGIIVG